MHISPTFFFILRVICVEGLCVRTDLQRKQDDVLDRGGYGGGDGYHRRSGGLVGFLEEEVRTLEIGRVASHAMSFAHIPVCGFWYC